MTFLTKQTELMTGPAFVFFLFFQRKIENLKVTKLGMEIVLIAKK